jgi:hypothetical protein
VTLEEIADRLYALPPEDFTAARTAEAAAARKAADKDLAKQVTALRKPTVGAWLVNTLARAEPDLLEQLLSLGPALAEAQRQGQGDTLRQLGEQRRQLIGAVTGQAFEAAGRSPVAAARAEVESTLEAALADPASAEAVRSGRLVRALSYAGFGEVDVTDAVAVPTSGRPTKAAAKAAPKAEPPKKDIAGAEARALEAAGALDDAVRECEQAVRDHDQATADRVQAEEEVRAAEQALHEARELRTEAEEAERKAARAATRAEQAVRQAQEKAEKARNALDKLRRS